MRQQERQLIRIRDESGNLSIDFLVGFTIFILAFIWVATMIPGIMIGLQSQSIDYDAVAYRTGVLLVEDPGWPAIPGWETISDGQKKNITRFGLAISKDTPNILSEDKVDRFFNTTSFVYPDDYQTRVIFGDYPYRFNISLYDVEKDQTKTVGDLLPSGYGNIRRLAKIKSMSNATINASVIEAFRYANTENVTQHEFAIQFNNSKLLSEMKDPLYQIDLSTDPVTVNITDLRSTLYYNPLDPDPSHGHVDPSKFNITLTKVWVYQSSGNPAKAIHMGDFDNVILDDDLTATKPPCEVKDRLTLKITPDFVKEMQAQYTSIYFNLTFELHDGSGGAGGPLYASTFLNNTNARAPAFDYNYNPKNVTQPRLRDATVEVAVW
jgi:hypothetical protein